MKYHVSFDVEFRKNPFKGLYIVLEGIDGSGKTTQVDKLYDYFREQGREVIKVREPRKDEGKIGKLIQEILNGTTEVPPVAIQYLFTADREMHHEEVIIPALKEDKIVISDRNFWSAIPYGILDIQGDINKDSVDRLFVAQSILSMYHQFLLPDITFYLNVPLSIAMERVDESSSTKTKEIYEDEKKIKSALQGYKWLLKQFPEEFTIINAKNSPEEIMDNILNKLKELKK
jgi:dTMP kinase